MKNEIKNIAKNTKGITLIALVITIIVLLILAGVSIAMLTGENGILNQAQEAKSQTEFKSAEEKVKLAIMGARADDGQMTVDELKTEVGYQGGSVTGDAFPVQVQMDGHTFTVDANGVISDKGTGGGNTPSGEEISKSESYVGYYADIDGDKTVDGIIYADLAVGGSGTWNSNSRSSYEYAKVAEGLKSYSISSENGTGFGNWEKPVVTAKEGTTGKDRFYVMALEDFNLGRYYCWYDAAWGKLDNPVEFNVNDFGQGKTNTTTMIEKWNSSGYGPQDDGHTYKDMWGAIQKADNAGKTWDLNKWFVPSKGEWAAFGDMAFTKIGVTTGNYDDYRLTNIYWSSAQYNTRSAHHPTFGNGYMSHGDVNSVFCPIRLSATF